MSNFHEFCTPLTLLLGPLEEVLAKAETNPLSDDRSLVHLAHRDGVRLLKLVNTLLGFSRIEAGAVVLRQPEHLSDDTWVASPLAGEPVRPSTMARSDRVNFGRPLAPVGTLRSRPTLAH
jgi:signal transduction histidine kinase